MPTPPTHNLIYTLYVAMILLRTPGPELIPSYPSISLAVLAPLPSLSKRLQVSYLAITVVPMSALAFKYAHVAFGAFVYAPIVWIV